MPQHRHWGDQEQRGLLKAIQNCLRHVHRTTPSLETTAQPYTSISDIYQPTPTRDSVPGNPVPQSHLHALIRPLTTCLLHGTAELAMRNAMPRAILWTCRTFQIHPPFSLSMLTIKKQLCAASRKKPGFVVKPPRRDASVHGQVSTVPTQRRLQLVFSPGTPGK